MRNKFIFCIIAIIFCLNIFLVLPGMVFAADTEQGNLGYTLEVPLPPNVTEVSSLPEYIKVVYNFSMGLLSLLALLMILWGGFEWITAAGNESKIGEAKAKIIAAIVGLLTGLGSYIILTTINPNLVSFTMSIPKVTSQYSSSSGATGGNGSCSECPAGTVCSVDSLTPYFGDDAAIMSAVCSVESSCGQSLVSGTDYCIESLESAYGISYANATIEQKHNYSVSFGAFQIHLPSEIRAQTADDGTQKPCKDAFSGWSANDVNGDHCTIVDQTLYENCKNYVMNTTTNLEIAKSKYENGGLSHWNYTAKTKCGFDF